MKIFIYETLKNKNTLMKALHEDHAKHLRSATLHGYTEVWINQDHQKWPTLSFVGSKGDTEGDIIELSHTEVDKLDRWEKRYRRGLVETNLGPAQAYFYMGAL